MKIKLSKKLFMTSIADHKINSNADFIKVLRSFQLENYIVKMALCLLLKGEANLVAGQERANKNNLSLASLLKEHVKQKVPFEAKAII